MARTAHRYPQVEIGARALMDTTVATVAATASVADALRVVRRRGVSAVVAGDSIVLRDDLTRAAPLGVDAAPAHMLARPVPVVATGTSEIVVRRHFMAGAPLVAVRDGRRIVGAVAAPISSGLSMSLADRFTRGLSVEMRAVLDAVARAAVERDARAYLAGGIVRDALVGWPLGAADLDVVVEGDGPGVARALALALGAPLLEHVRFLTATVGPTVAGRIDVATARTERYDARGALPRVMPSSIEQDLRRRDFAVNAMAVELASGAFGILDRQGGRDDLAARRLRILHPASFVEDPTRIFRAARYAERLALRPDVWTTRCEAWALSLVPYPALSGARLLAEVDHILREARPEAVFASLGAHGAYRLLDPRHRFTPRTRTGLQVLTPTLAWAREHGLDVVGPELVLVALLADQDEDVRLAALRRLEVSGEPRTRIARAIGEHADVARAVSAARRPSARARLLRSRSALELAWLWLRGDASMRAHVTWFRDAGQARPVLRGDEVIALGVPADSRVAGALEALRDARLDGEVVERGEAEAFVRAWAREHDAHAHRARDHSSRKER